jgi:hypothetical protein
MLVDFVWELFLPVVVVAVLLVALDRSQGTGLTRYFLGERRGPFLGGCGLVLVAIAVTYALGSPPPFERSSVGLYHLGLIGLTVGVMFVVHGWRHYQFATTVKNALVATPGDAPSGELVAITGEARATSTTALVDFDDGSAALVVERGRLVGAGAGLGREPDTTRANPLLSPTRHSVPFDLVEDGHRVRVEPGDAALSFLQGEIEGETLHRTVEPDEVVTVVGDLENGRIDDPLVIADEHSQALRRFARNVPRLAWAGPPIAVVSYVVMLFTAGVV